MILLSVFKLQNVDFVIRSLIVISFAFANVFALKRSYICFYKVNVAYKSIKVSFYTVSYIFILY